MRQGRRFLDINPDILSSYDYYMLPDGEKAALIRSAMNGDVWPGFEDYFKPGFERASTGKWFVIRLEVFERDGYRCVYCGDTEGPFDCDHVIPASKGGTDDLSNLATACAHCNRSKGARTPKEWRQ